MRIIQSIPSPKAEPFKLWLAQVGSDRLDEIENPELATQRTRELESRTGKKVVSTDNYLPEAKKNKELRKDREEK